MNVKMKVKGILFTAVLMGILLIANTNSPILAETHFIPTAKVPPIIDGNITKQEWNSSVQLKAALGDRRATVYVTSANESLFFGLNFTNPEFEPVNASAPINQTHDFVALQIDNNLDKKSLGTLDSPDDLLVVDQYNETSFDGFTTANGTAPIAYDTTVNGTNEGIAKRLNQTVNGETLLGYEFSKPANGNDEKGADFKLDETNILQFRFVYWFNASANATISEAISTEWFSLRVNETGTGFALAPKTNQTNLLIDSIGKDNEEGLKTVLNLFGYNYTINKDTSVFNNTDFNKDALIVVMVGSEGYSTQNINALTDFIRNGGQAIVFLSNQTQAAKSASRTIAEKFGIEFLTNRILQNGDDVVLIPKSNFNSKLAFSSGKSVAIDREAEAVQFTTGALNITDALNQTFIESQRFAIYNLFENLNGLVYDENGNLVADSGESYNENLSLGVGIDLQIGGRLALFPTNPLTDNYLTKADNIEYFLRLIPWANKHISRIQVNNFTLSQNNMSINTLVTISANITDIFGEKVPENVEARVVLRRAGSIQNEIDLFDAGNGIYTGELKVSTYGWQEFEIEVFAYGYGFAQGEKLPIFVEKAPPKFNSLSDINIFLAITGFILTPAVFFYGYKGIKKQE